MKAYHFTSDTLRDGRPIPPIGEWMEHDGPIVPCESGLHASEHPFDALSYAPGNFLHLVEIEGDLQGYGEPVDKVIGRRRKILATIDAEPLLREFARWCALQVIHLWDAPQSVKEYLGTGDESRRAEAWAAATAATRDAATAAARDAVTIAATIAARDAATIAATIAARYAAWNAARGAARDAATIAATIAATTAARYAAWNAARDAQRSKFKELVAGAFEKQRELIL